MNSCLRKSPLLWQTLLLQKRPHAKLPKRTRQHNITDIIDRAKADYRLTHKVGVQSCKVYIKPEEEAAYYVVNKVSGKLPL